MGAYDLGELGPASVVAGGLSGLLEAYKMKMGQDVEQAKQRQAAFSTNATLTNSMAEHKMTQDSAAAALAEKEREFNTPPKYVTIPDPNTPGGYINVGVSGGGKITNLTKGTGKGAGVDAAKQEKLLHHAAAAYMAMDQYKSLASGFAPADSTTGALLTAPWDKARQTFQETSPQANTAAKIKDAAVLYATGINVGGGGRMTEAEVDNVAKGMGGSAIGETQQNLDQKLGPMKDQLAMKMGLTRGQVEDYVNKYRDSGLPPLPPEDAPGPMSTLRAALPKAATPTAGGRMFRIKASDGTMHDVPDVNAARKIDPNLVVVGQ